MTGDPISSLIYIQVIILWVEQTKINFWPFDLCKQLSHHLDKVMTFFYTQPYKYILIKLLSSINFIAYNNH